MTAFVCGAKIGYPFTYQVIFPFLPIPQHIWVGKDVRGWWGNVAPRQEEEDVLPALGFPGMLEDAGDAGGCRDHENLVIRGWQLSR